MKNNVTLINSNQKNTNLKKEDALLKDTLYESEIKYNILAEMAQDYIFIVTAEGLVEYVNKFAASQIHKNPSELIGQSLSNIFHGELYQRQIKNIQQVILTQTPIEVETESFFSNHIVWLNTRLSPIFNEQNTVTSVLGISRDITHKKIIQESLISNKNELELLVKQRTFELEKINYKLKKEITDHHKTEELLKQQLNEKLVLLKEIHHRVKNNMQVIISLLNLQASTIKDKKMLGIYKESQNRIKSMALIHEKLYQSKDLTHIDFSEYIISLTNHLSLTYLNEDKNIDISSQSERVSLEIDSIISIGLIINELVSNSIKYAFTNKKNGKIKISLEKIKENELHLCISDNGKGIPAEINFRNSRTLGLQLVCSLTEQIGGDINLNNKNGTKFCIKFPYIK